VLCGVVVAADQAAKALVSAHLVPGQTVAVLGPLELTLAHNRGVAFGLASGGGAILVLFTVVALAVAGAVFARRAAQGGMWVAFGLVAGGALGNVADRLRTGVVTDYIHVLSWPPFNLADVAITVGIAIFVALYLAPAQSPDA
jgi:signal peptidase II